MTLARRLRDYFSPRELIDTSPRISDEVKCTTCYMCACRCGIKVHLRDGAIRYIEGNRDHPVNRGGMTKILEAVRQLRGEAHPKVQVKNCDLAIAHGTGGLLGNRHAASTCILERV